MRSQNLVNGTILILLGLAFLGRNLGILPGIPWSNLWQLWPVFLIIFGLQVLFPKGKMSVLAPIILIIAVVIALFGLGPFQRGVQDYGSQRQSLALAESTTQAGLTLRNVGVAHLRVIGGELEGSQAMEYSANRQVIDRSDVEVSPAKTDYYLYGRSSSRWVGMTALPNVHVVLDTGVHWHLDLSLGVGAVKADLQSLPWEQLRIDAGVGQISVQAGPAAWARTMAIHNGVGSVSLDLHREIPVSVRLNTPSFMNNLERAGFVRDGDRYVSANYRDSDTPLDITVDGGISQVSVRWNR